MIETIPNPNKSIDIDSKDVFEKTQYLPLITEFMFNTRNGILKNYKFDFVSHFEIKKIVLFLAFCLGLSYLSLAQTKDQKHIDNGDFAKAENNLTKTLEKKPTDIAALYTMANLYINRGFQSYNPHKAYNYISKAIVNFSYLKDAHESFQNGGDHNSDPIIRKSLGESSKEFMDLNKISLNMGSLNAVTNTICKEALTDATTINTVGGYNEFLEYYKTSPQDYKNVAIVNRNIAAFKIATSLNTVASYQEFINTYPNAMQVQLATSTRNALVFNIAKEANTIKEYEKFISTYPAATEVEQAWSRIHDLAFEVAKKENSSKAFKAFMDKYPKSNQFADSKNLYLERQFLENTTVGDWESYRGFIENYASNPWIENAKDSIFRYGEKTQDLTILKYVAKEYLGDKKKTALIYLHDLIIVNGEKITLDEFYKEFDDPLIQELKAKDYAPFGGDDSQKIINYLKGYQQLSNENDIDILKSNVFDYFDLEIGSELKREQYKSSKEFKVYQDSLNKMKSNIKGLSYIVFSGVQSWNKQNEYDVKTGGFYFYTGNRSETSENFDVRNKIDLEYLKQGDDVKVVFTNINTVIKNTSFESGMYTSEFKDEHLFIPVSKKIGTLIEESSNYPKIYILFNCTGYKTVTEHQKWSGLSVLNDYLVGTVKRIFITSDDIIVYEKVY
jgi:hypothetical protein